jgi:hypothetical protein
MNEVEIAFDPHVAFAMAALAGALGLLLVHLLILGRPRR